MDMSFDEPVIVTLLDEDGKEYEFECLETFIHEDEKYIVLAAISELEGIEDDEAVVLKVVENEDGTDSYLPIESAEKLQEIFQIYLQMVEDDEEYEDEEDFEDEEDEKE